MHGRRGRLRDGVPQYHVAVASCSTCTGSRKTALIFLLSPAGDARSHSRCTAACPARQDGALAAIDCPAVLWVKHSTYTATN